MAGPDPSQSYYANMRALGETPSESKLDVILAQFRPRPGAGASNTLLLLSKSMFSVGTEDEYFGGGERDVYRAQRLRPSRGQTGRGTRTETRQVKAFGYIQGTCKGTY